MLTKEAGAAMVLLAWIAVASSLLAPRVQVMCGHSSMVDPFAISIAQREAAALFQKDHIRLEWVQAVLPDDPAPLFLVLLRKSDSYDLEVPREALGVTFVWREGKPGRVSVLFWDRLEDLAGRASLERQGRVLGRAIAHEIGHALQRRVDHSDEGLMRAVIPRSRWTAGSRRPFYLCQTDAQAIRSRLTNEDP